MAGIKEIMKLIFYRPACLIEIGNFRKSAGIFWDFITTEGKDTKAQRKKSKKHLTEETGFVKLYFME